MFGLSKAEREARTRKKLESALIEAAKKGDCAKITRLLDTGVNINATDKDNISPLVWVALENYEKTVKLLIARGADLDLRTKNSNTPLMLAARFEHTGIVRLLVAAGANTSLRHSSGKTAAEDCATDEIRAIILGEPWPPAPRDKKESAPQNPDLFEIAARVSDTAELREIFNFATRERITVMTVAGVPSTPVRESFDDIKNQETVLRAAFDEHKRRGGTRDESVIAHRQKQAVDLPDLVLRPRPSPQRQA